MDKNKILPKRIVEPYIPQIFSEDYEATVQGWLGRLIGALERPVVMYVKEDSKEENFKKIPDVSRSYSDIALYCSKLRSYVSCDNNGCKCTWEEKVCDKNDNNAAKSIFALHNNPKGNTFIQNIKKEKHQCGNTEFEFYSYTCPETSLTEWGIPIVLYDQVIGVFLTGQFITDIDETIGKLKDHANSIEDSKIREEFINNLKNIERNPTKPSDNQMDDFVGIIRGIQTALEKAHKNVCRARATTIGNEILSSLSGSLSDKNGKNDDENKTFERKAKSIQEYNARFRLVRIGLFKGIWNAVIKELKLIEVTVFKPPNNVSLIDNMNVISGAQLNENVRNRTEDCAFKKYDKDYKSSEYSIDFNSTAWNEGIGSATANRYFYEFSMTDESKIKDIFVGTPPEGLDRSSLHIYAIRGMERFAVAYLLQYPDKETMDFQYDYIENILRTVSSLYLALWNAVYADWQRFRTDMVSKYIAHELAQIMISLQSHSKQFSNFHSEANKEVYHEKSEFSERYKKVYTLIDESRNFVSDTQRAEKVITSTAKCIELLDPFGELTLHRFMVYETILHNWIDVITYRCKFDYKVLENPWVTISDSTRPKMYADSERMEQVVYNLLNNAYKYGHHGSKIYLNSQLSKDRKSYEIVVTSYGMEMLADDNIFDLGVRGKYAERMSKSGSGFGLYVVKTIIEKHDGQVTASSKKVSDYNVPLLGVYAGNESFAGRSESTAEKCKQEIIKLREENKYDSVLGKRMPLTNRQEHDLSSYWMSEHTDIPGQRNIAITPLVLTRSIDWETFENTFVVSIPHKEEVDI
ncbi:MAG: PocR ligand-binding domain-containing protein [Lachnoclostridium sp.]|nr:PocR ligand-binding domain-containing protein [Lachnoclostridium sp.]